MSDATASPSFDARSRRNPSRSGRPDPHRLGHSVEGESKATGRGTGGPAPKRIVVGYGFWLFVLSDIILFSSFFASYAVLQDGTADGPTGHDIFDLGSTAMETGCLLLSSFTCGMASLAMQARSTRWFYGAMGVTFLFGAIFLALEIHEFAGLVERGAGPSHSAFLSAFFALVGCHGLHVTAGLMWLLTMMAQVFFKGFRENVVRRIMCFALFWHALDIVWVAIFSVVYILGVIA